MSTSEFLVVDNGKYGYGLEKINYITSYPISINTK